MISASGGAKMLGLAHLDRFLFGDYLQRTDHPMALYGSSIGSWRNAALASPLPLASLLRLQDLQRFVKLHYVHVSKVFDGDIPRG